MAKAGDSTAVRFGLANALVSLGRWQEAEVELEHAEQKSPIPSWLKTYVVREVTDESAYRNYEIALRAVKATSPFRWEKSRRLGWPATTT